MAELARVGRALGDATRVRIMAQLAEEPRPLCGQDLAGRLAITPQTISHHLAILREAGLVRAERRQTARYYALDAERIQRMRERCFNDNRLGLPTREQMRVKVLAAFFDGDRLTSIPTQPGKRQYVLEELARAFTWGRIYDEREVNAILAHRHDDTAQLRRLLVDAGLLARDAGRYWKPQPDLDTEGDSTP
jgi:biotin operon repressor